MNNIFNYNDSINYLKSKLSNNYAQFAKDFMNYKSLSGENMFDYVHLDNYAIIDLSTIYNYDDYLQWVAKNNVSAKEFIIHKE